MKLKQLLDNSCFNINMMKKILLVLGILMCTICSANAYSLPRWTGFPLTVYLPDNPEALIVKSAFENWKGNSKGIARFIYRKSNVARTTSNINIIFFDKLPSGKAYELSETFATRAMYTVGKTNAYYYHVDIKISLKDKEDKNYSRQELFAISLQAIGRALGIPCQGGDVGVMVCDEKYNVDNVTKEDYQALFRVYKRVNKDEMEKYKN